MTKLLALLLIGCSPSSSLAYLNRCFTPHNTARSWGHLTSNTCATCFKQLLIPWFNVLFMKKKNSTKLLQIFINIWKTFPLSSRQLFACKSLPGKCSWLVQRSYQLYFSFSPCWWKLVSQHALLCCVSQMSLICACGFLNQCKIKLKLS